MLHYGPVTRSLRFWCRLAFGCDRCLTVHTVATCHISHTVVFRSLICLLVYYTPTLRSPPTRCRSFTPPHDFTRFYVARLIYRYTLRSFVAITVTFRSYVPHVCLIRDSSFVRVHTLRSRRVVALHYTTPHAIPSADYAPRCWCCTLHYAPVTHTILRFVPGRCYTWLRYTLRCTIWLPTRSSLFVTFGLRCRFLVSRLICSFVATPFHRSTLRSPRLPHYWISYVPVTVILLHFIRDTFYTPRYGW